MVKSEGRLQPISEDERMRYISGCGVVEVGASTPTNGQRMQVSVQGAGEDGQGARTSVGF